MRAILLIEHSEEIKLISSCLRGTEVEFIESDSLEGVKQAINNQSIDFLIADFSFPGVGNGDLVTALHEREQRPFLMFLVDEASQSKAVDALGEITGDYILKPISSESFKARFAVASRTRSMMGRLERILWESKTLALYDSLTGIFNRQAIYDHALAEVSRARREDLPFSLVMIEIINLLEIEKEHGPELTERMIRYVCSAVRANVRIYDLLGRWIGPKLLLALPNTQLEDTLKVIERVQQSIQAIEIEIPDTGQLAFDVNYGISNLRPQEDIPLYALVEQANSALIQARTESDKQVVPFQG